MTEIKITKGTPRGFPNKNGGETMTTTFDPTLMENNFQDWYKNIAQRLSIDPNPDAPGNDYDWRAAWIYGQHTGQPIPGPDNQLPAYFNTAPAPAAETFYSGQGLPETIAKASMQPQPWKVDLGPSQAWAGPPPVQFAEPPQPQFSERFSQVATAPVPPPASKPLTLAGKPAIGPDMSKYSDEQLMTIAGIKPEQKDLSQYSDAELMQIAGIQPQKQVMGVGEILKDPDFHNLPQAEQHKVLSTVDPDFAGLPPEEQAKVLSHIAPQGGQSAGPVQRVEVPGFGVVQFPAGMSQQEMERVIQEQVYGKQQTQGAGGADAGAQPEITDPLADSLNAMRPVEAVKELGKLVAEHGPALGTMATAATKLPGIVAAPLTGMATAAGGLLNRAYTGKETPLTPEEQTLMDLGLPFATGEMGRVFLTGVGAEFGGRGIAWGAGKLLAPAAGKITDAGRSFMEFAKKNNLPYSPDAVNPIWRSKLAQGLADTGVGKWFTTRQRAELVQGTSEAAGKVLDDLGLPAPLAPTEAAGDLANHLRQLSNKKLTHAYFNEAMGRIPAESEMAVPNLMQALDDIGGLSTIEKIYAGKSGKAPREFGLFKRVINRDGVITKDEIDYLNKSIWRKYKDMDPESKGGGWQAQGRVTQ
jgi:hypothetical protein